MKPFDYFVIFAEMRTGSNFLETNINAIDGLHCYGEAFNPHFIGHPAAANILGVTQARREVDPQHLIDTIKGQTDGFGGFRFFHDHDPRVPDICLPDPRCAKIVLTRNPVDSYVSRKTAAATGQWKLTDARHARTALITFDPTEFKAHLHAVQSFQSALRNRLQRSGQTAFHVNYDDLQDVDVMNGIAAFLGCTARTAALDTSLKRQNTTPLRDKVRNYDEMKAALADLDLFNLSRVPGFEPRRSPVVPGFVAAPQSPLLYLTIRSGPEHVVRNWLSGLDGSGSVQDGFTHKTLRQWKQARPGHRSFTVLRHPLARAHAAFCDHILPTGPGSFRAIRATLRAHYGLPIPDHAPGSGYDDATHRTAFIGFLRFLKANLSGQTSLRIDPAWAGQSTVLQGIATIVPPDMILREDRLGHDLAILAAQIGKDKMPAVPGVTDPHAAQLSRIYDAGLETAARDAYARDYLTFGFADWA